MAFTPHTPADIESMLATLGLADVQALFDEIPADLLSPDVSSIPDPLSEMDVMQHMRERAHENTPLICFAGGGAYDHFIPAAVWDVASRGEYMTAYTPYQAEASQGTLQLIYEYQTMMASLMGMEVSNASLYDGASACAEAALMAVRLQKKDTMHVIVPSTLHPHYLQTLRSLCGYQGLVFDVLDIASMTASDLESTVKNAAALVIPMPDFFGELFDVDTLTNMAHAHNTLVIAVVNPLAMSLLKPPGQWGDTGADIACGDGQPLGVPMSCGGPYFGFMTCKMAMVRQMPGRIVGATVDMNGKRGYTLTLQAREQHIRRAKATSNICTNQGLLVTAATIYMSLMGEAGLKRVALTSHARMNRLRERLATIGIQSYHSGPVFHERVFILPMPAEAFLEGMIAEGILAGIPLGPYYPELTNGILVCTTEMRTEEECDAYVSAASRVLSQATVGKLATTFSKHVVVL